MKSFDTTDLLLAATLKINGYTLDKITKSGQRGTFWFSDVDEAILTDYDLGKCRVDPVALHAAIKALTTSTKRMNGDV